MLNRLVREIWRRFTSKTTASAPVDSVPAEGNFLPDAVLQSSSEYPVFKNETDAQNWLRLVVLPYLNDCVKFGRVVEAERAEQKAYTQAIKAFEDSRHYEICFRILHPTLQTLGSNARPLGLGSRAAPERNWRPDGLVFFVHNLNAELAHNELLCNVIRAYLDGVEVDCIEAVPIRLIGGGVKPAKCYESLARDFRISIECLGVGSLYSNLELVARQLDERPGERCIVVAVPLGISYLSGQIDPRRLGWLSMKFEIDAFSPTLPCYAFTTSERSCHQRGATVWRTAPPLMNTVDLALTSSDSSFLTANAENFARFDVMLFTINREEKIRSPEFLDAVSNILRENPRACFVWTGRTRLAEIDNSFRDQNVLDRTFFAGWVVPDTLLQRGDIFLDTPLLSGMTAAKAVANGVPVLTFAGAHSWVNFFADKLQEIDQLPHNDLLSKAWCAFQKAELQLECGSVHAYVSQAQRLIADETLRSIYADFMKAFGQYFFCGNSRYARMHFENFLAPSDSVL